MNPCNKCKRPMHLKCCHNCKKDAAECDVWHKCGEDCKEWEAQIQTNADRIREMSDEELAERLIFWNDDYGRWETDAGNFDGDPNDTKETAIKAELEWLKQPAEVDNG